MSRSSTLFQPYRALGFITDQTPFHLRKSGTNNFITVSIGKAWQSYNCDKLRLLFVGKPEPVPLRAVVSTRDFVFTAAGSNIHKWKRTEKVATFSGHEGDVYLLYVFGSSILSVGEDQTLRIWSIHTEKCIRTIQLPVHDRIVAIVHPDTYLNKIVLGFQSGAMELWNIRVQKKIFSFPVFSSAITCLCDSPALDVIGIGLADGSIVIHNLRYNITITTFQHSEHHGAVTSLSFRTDGVPLLVSGSSKGHMIVWNLNKKQIQTIVRQCHEQAIVSLEFFKDEPLLITSGADNTIKIWIFDAADGSPRLLRSRSGHSDPPNRIRFYGSEGKTLLSSGLDRSLRHFSVIRDEQNVEFSQGHLLKKAKQKHIRVQDLRLREVVQFAANPVKERQWANVISCHLNDKAAYIWGAENKVLQKKKLFHGKTPVKSVAISACGNFGIVGHANGAIHRFNMQSGQLRGSFGDKETRHSGAVVGLDVDSINKLLISGSHDGSVKVWRFQTQKLLNTINFNSSVTHILLNKDSELLAVTTDELIVTLYDINTLKRVRKFGGHKSRISDLTFSSDGRWLLTSSMDSSIRVFDIPSGRLIDWFRFDKPVTSLAFSPTSEFLVTTHVDSVGLFLWINKSHFTNVYLKTAQKVPFDMDMDVVPSERKLEFKTLEQVDLEHEMKMNAGSAEFSEDSDTSSSGDEGSYDSRFDLVKFAGPLSSDLITFSDLPASNVFNIANLDLIKERNKPIEAVSKPIEAPFFLPSTDSVPEPEIKQSQSNSRPKRKLEHGEKEQGDQEDDTQFQSFGDAGEGDWSDPEEDDIDSPERYQNNATKSGSKLLRAQLSMDSKFVRLLKSGNCNSVTQYLKALGPSAVDTQIRELGGMDAEKETKELGFMLDYLCHEVRSKQNFELIQVYINVFLNVHMNSIMKDTDLLERVKVLAEQQRLSWKSFEDKFHKTLCLVGLFSNLQ